MTAPLTGRRTYVPSAREGAVNNSRSRREGAPETARLRRGWCRLFSPATGFLFSRSPVRPPARQKNWDDQEAALRADRVTSRTAGGQPSRWPEAGKRVAEAGSGPAGVSGN